MPDFAELGRKSLPQADLLSAAPERRSLRGVGAAAGNRGRSSRGLQTTAQIVEQWSSPVSVLAMSAIQALAQAGTIASSITESVRISRSTTLAPPAGRRPAG